MILVDTSVWVAHFRGDTVALASLLNTDSVVCHPFIVGELACGNLPSRSNVIQLLQALPQGIVAEPEEILAFIEKRKMMGRGIGYVDAHLLVSCLLSHVPVWTFDRRLRIAASELGILASDPPSRPA